jgi:transposase-like protein
MVARARLVLAAQAGEHAPAVAGRLGVAAGTVRLWVRRFNAAGGPPAPGVALMSVVIGTLFLHEPRNVKIWDEVGGEDEPGVVARAAAQAE